MSFEGIYTAVITPFKASGHGIDENLFKKLIERQIQGGVSGLIIAGSTGEGQTMSLDEWKQALQIALTYREKIQILGAYGTSSTEQTRDRYKELSDLGAYGALISTPAYNRPPQRGLIKHYETIASAAKLPIMVYNIPGRTGSNITPATMLEIWKLPQVSALKDSSGNFEQSMAYLDQCPAGKAIFSGDDPLNLAFFANGARGAVSVVSNILPGTTAHSWKAFKSGDLKTAQDLQFKLMKLIPLLFCESNPIPTKWLMGKIMGADMSPRLPLVPLEQAHHTKLKSTLDELTALGLS